MSKNTARKYIRQLENRELIATESTEVVTRSSGRRTDNPLFTLWSIQEVVNDHYSHQREQLELAAERQQIAKLIQKREIPAVTACAPLCAGPAARAGYSPSYRKTQCDGCTPQAQLPIET